MYVGEQRADDGIRYLLYKDTSQWNDFLVAPPGKAYYDCQGRLYVTTYDADDPDEHEMHVSKRGIGLTLAGADYIRIRNLEFRYYGLYGVHLAGPGADYNIIEGNTFHGIGRYQIRIGDWDTSYSADNLIQDNLFYEVGYRDSGWTWDAAYHHAGAIGVRVNYAGPGNVIRRNTIKNGTDGIDVDWQSSDTDVYENEIEDCMDDGIEVDDQPGYNIRVWRNTIRHCYSGISNQGWFKGDYWNAGPVYVFRNVILGGNDAQGRKDTDGDAYFTGYAFKVGADQDGSGRAYYYHNTIYMPSSSAHGAGVQDAGGQHFSGVVARNNLWDVGYKVFNLRYATAILRHDLDCDNLHNPGTPTDTHFIQWSNRGGPEGNGTYRNLSDFQAYTGQELHAISNTGTLYNPDLSLRPGSPEIDAGCVIVGINDHGPWVSQGQRPDIGAFEYGGSDDVGFSLSLEPAVQAIAPSRSAAFKIGIQPIGAFTSSVTLSVANPSSPSPGLSVNLDPATLTPPGQATLTVTDEHPDAPLLPGVTYALQVTAVGGDITRTTTIRVLVGGTKVFLPLLNN
jgi:hypothetical protein